MEAELKQSGDRINLQGGVQEREGQGKSERNNRTASKAFSRMAGRNALSLPAPLPAAAAARMPPPLHCALLAAAASRPQAADGGGWGA